MRPHSGTEHPESPFSELLETSEAPEAGAPEPTSPPAEDAGKKALPAEAKAVPPKGPPESPPGKDGEKGKSELVLSIVLPPGHFPDAEVPVVRSKLGQTLSEAISNRPKPESETDSPELPAPTGADATDVTALAPLAPAAVAVPVPAALPALDDSPVPVESETTPAIAEAITPAIAEATIPATAEATVPAVTDVTVTTPVGVPVSAPADMPPESKAQAPTTSAPNAKVEAPAVEVAAPIGQTSEDTAPVRSSGKEKKAPPAEKVAHATTEATSSAKKAAPVASKPTIAPEVSPDPEISQDAEVPPDAEVSSHGDDVSAQKAPTRSTEPAAIANAARGDLDTPDARPSSAEGLANSTSPLPPLAAPVAAQHAAQPSNERPVLTDMVPVAGLAVAIAAHAQTGKNHFEIRLDPPELGRIDVRLDVHHDGQVTSHLRVERPETLDLLRRDAPALERALQQAGLKTSDNGLQFSLRDHSFSQRNQSHDTPAMARLVVPDEKLMPAETQRHYGRRAGLGSGVDIRV